MNPFVPGEDPFEKKHLYKNGFIPERDARQ